MKTAQTFPQPARADRAHIAERHVRAVILLFAVWAIAQ
jgi:hypothetical protein